MLKKDFWYDLPKELIAQEPASPRDAARLMVLSQKDDSIQHKVFRDLPEFLEPGDLLVVNNSKVLPARIVGCLTPTMRAGRTLELFTTKRSPGSRNSGRSRNTLCRMLSSFWLRTISRAASRGDAGSCAMSSLGKSYQKSFFNILCICLSDD